MGIKLLVLSLTGQCNLACRYCYAAAHSKQRLSLSAAKKAIDLVAAGGDSFVLQFTGGEPLLAFDRIKEITEYIESQKIPARIQLQTNGTLLTEEMAAFFKQMRIGLGVSLDGRAYENDRQRCYADGRGSTVDTIAGIRLLAAENLEIGLTCVVTAENVTSMAGVVDMAYYLGNVRVIGFDLLRQQGNGKVVSEALPEDFRKGLLATFRRAEELSSLTGRLVKITQLEQARHVIERETTGFSHCHAMNGEALYVEATGDLYACASLLGDKNFFLGNILSTGLDTERQKEIIVQIRDNMQFCRCCPDFLQCGGACFARWYGTGKTEKYENECVLKKQMLEIAVVTANCSVESHNR